MASEYQRRWDDAYSRKQRIKSSCLQAAREIASTISSANNRVFLSADSLLLNLVSHQAC